MKLNILIISAFILVGLISSLIGGVMYYDASQKIMEAQVSSNLLAISESRAEHIETYMNQNIERLKLITSKTQLKIELEKYNEDKTNQEALNKLTKIINDAKEPIEDFERICVIGLDGIVVSSTDDNFCGKDVADKEFFVKGKEKNAVYFVNENNELKMMVSGPFIQEKKLLGVGITVLTLDKMKNIVESKTGLGETGEVLVAMQVEGEINFIFERLFEGDALFGREALISEKDGGISAEPMRQALLGNELIFRASLDYRNEPVIAASQYVSSVDLGLVAKIDLEEITGSYKKVLIKNSGIIGGVILLLSLVMGFFVSRRITRPLRQLTAKVNEITNGKLDIQLDKSRIFELQSLIDSLNRILASMKLAILRTGVNKTSLGLGGKTFSQAKVKDTTKKHGKVAIKKIKSPLTPLAEEGVNKVVQTTKKIAKPLKEVAEQVVSKVKPKTIIKKQKQRKKRGKK